MHGFTCSTNTAIRFNYIGLALSLEHFSASLQPSMKPRRPEEANVCVLQSLEAVSVWSSVLLEFGLHGAPWKLSIAELPLATCRWLPLKLPLGLVLSMTQGFGNEPKGDSRNGSHQYGVSFDSTSHSPGLRSESAWATQTPRQPMERWLRNHSPNGELRFQRTWSGTLALSTLSCQWLPKIRRDSDLGAAKAMKTHGLGSYFTMVIQWVQAEEME